MNMQNRPRRDATKLVVPLAGLIAALLAQSVAGAVVVSDPTGSAAVATSGESASAKHVAVSNGGSAHAGCDSIAPWTCGPSAAVSTTGSAEGYWTGLSGTGSAGGYTSASALGQSCGTISVNIAGTTCAYGALVDVSAAGSTNSSSAVAVSGLNDAEARCHNVALGQCVGDVAVSGAGTASGNVAVEAMRARVQVTEPVTGMTVGIDNTGDLRAPLTEAQVLDHSYQPDPVVNAVKDAWAETALAEVQYQLAAHLAGLDPTLADQACPHGTCFPVSGTVPMPIQHQETSFWCGPATTQAILAGMGRGDSQANLARALNTTKDGTSYFAITRVLNERVPDDYAYFIWTKLARGSEGPASYMVRLIADVLARVDNVPHGIANNLRTDALLYWGDATNPAWHFNASYGYRLDRGGVVHVAEIYDPTKVNSKRRTNPYGYHEVPLAQVYEAVMKNKGIIVW